MSRVQVIEVDDKPVAYVVPADIWARLKAMVEDAEDAADYERAVAQDDGVRYPAPVAYAMADGAHPMKAWREHAGAGCRFCRDQHTATFGCLHAKLLIRKEIHAGTALAMELAFVTMRGAPCQPRPRRPLRTDDWSHRRPGRHR